MNKDEITKQVMEEYELIRQGGYTNMFDYYTVIEVARLLNYSALAALSREDYLVVIANFRYLMDKHNIKQHKEKE